MRLLASLTVIVLCMSHQAPAQSALDTPAVPDRPTVRTELKRANNASGKCETKLIDSPPWQTDHGIFEYYHCMNDLIAVAAQNNTYSKAFEMGIFFEQTLKSAILLEVLENNAAGHESQGALLVSRKTLYKFGQEYFHRTMELGQKQGLTIYEICQGSGYQDCRKSGIPLFIKWGWAPAS